VGGDRIRVWLDDVRDAPPGWMRAFTPEQVVGLLALGNVTEISFGNDAGPGYGEPERTGFHVLLWLEREVGTGRWTLPLPQISVHSRNPAGRDRMLRVIGTLHRLRAMAEIRANGSGPPGPI
jgi:hypothetical protein